MQDEKDLELIMDEVDSELGDFEISPAKYQVWLLGYDQNEAITDFDYFIREFDDPDQAVDFARDYAAKEKFREFKIPEQIKFLEVEVETVVQTETDWEENVETLYLARITLED